MDDRLPAHIIELKQPEICHDCGRFTTCYPVSQLRDRQLLWRCDVCIVYASRSAPSL